MLCSNHPSSARSSSGFGPSRHPCHHRVTPAAVHQDPHVRVRLSRRTGLCGQRLGEHEVEHSIPILETPLLDPVADHRELGGWTANRPAVIG
jgi:hypothetical protein